jgi:ligand-binding sensor domain-containing protein
MKIERPLALVSLVVVLGLRPATALNPQTRITQYFHTAWRVQDGAFEGAPNAVAQTADGYIWIGTGSGLVKYDGARFDPWAPPTRGRTAPIRPEFGADAGTGTEGRQ